MAAVQSAERGLNPAQRKKADALLEQLRTGATLRAAAKVVGISPPLAMYWIQQDESFAEQYARAREIGYRVMADHVIDIADQAKDPQKARLQFDARRWLLSKALPKVYGDRINHEVTGGITVHLTPKDAEL